MKLNYVTLSKPETESFYVSRRQRPTKVIIGTTMMNSKFTFNKGGGVMIVGEQITNYNAMNLCF